MTLDDLILPAGESPLIARAAQHPDPEAAAPVYEHMERCSRLLALSYLVTPTGEDMTIRHEFAAELVRAEFAHRKITPGPNVRARMISPDDRALIKERARHIAATTRTAQENTQ